MKTTFTDAQKKAIAVAALNRAKKLNPHRESSEVKARPQPERPGVREGVIPNPPTQTADSVVNQNVGAGQAKSTTGPTQ